MYISITAEAIQRPGAKVPYLRKGFTVVGLPHGIPFRKPCDYGTKQIKDIISASGELKFITESQSAEIDQTVGSLADPSSEVPAGEGSSIEFHVSDFSAGLLPLVGGDRAKDAQMNRNLIKEDELDVVNIQLREDGIEELLKSSSHLFEESAIISWKANWSSSQKRKALLLPTYRTARCNFWLFYFEGFEAELEKLVESGQAIPGIWLHKIGNKDSRRYKLKPYTSINSVAKDNLIKDSKTKKFLFYEVDILAVGNTITIPENFHTAIYGSLAAAGFLSG